jgi:hypothetical protein
MAEIHIEQKKRSPLPWLLAAVLLVALLWFLFARNAGDGVASGVGADSSYRDTSAAAATLAPPADSAARLPDTTGAVPPR